MPDRPSLTDIELTTRRLLLRPWRREDAPAVVEAMQDRRMHEFLNLPDPYTRQDAITFTTEVGNANRADGSGLGCAVVERSSGAVVGSADLRFSKTNLLGADIGYAIYPRAQGNGYAAEVTRALTDWAHANGVNRVELRCAVTNLASAATALAAGFRFEGIQRAQLAIRAGEIEAACFSRLRTDDPAPVAPTFPKLGVVEDDAVRLRTFGPADSAAYAEQETDALTMRFSLRKRPPSPAEIAEQTRRAGLEWLVGPAASLVVEDRATGSFAGLVRVRLSGPPQVGLVGYAMHPAFRGRGYAGRGVRLAARWALTDAGLARLDLGAEVENTASQRVALAAGFRPDGVRQARLRRHDGTFGDEARFFLLRDHLDADAITGR